MGRPGSAEQHPDDEEQHGARGGESAKVGSEARVDGEPAHSSRLDHKRHASSTARCRTAPPATPPPCDNGASRKARCQWDRVAQPSRSVIFLTGRLLVSEFFRKRSISGFL